VNTLSITLYPNYTLQRPVTPFSAFPTVAEKSSVASPVIPTNSAPAEAVKSKPLNAVLTAAGLLGMGLMLNRIPAKASTFELVSTRLEDWVKMGLGILAVDKINEAANWKPKPWQHGLQTVTALTFLAQGLSLKGWKHFPLLAASVPLLVGGTHLVSDKTEAYLDSHDSNLPRWIPKLAISLGSTVGGVVGLRNVMQASWYTVAMGRLGAATGQQALGAEMLICSRCGGAHVVCMETLADFVAVMGARLKDLLPKGNDKNESQ